MRYVFLFILFMFYTIGFTQQNQYKVQTVAFYNLENLFDTIRNEQINDESFTPGGSYNWNTEKYENKLVNMAKVLSEIGTSNAMKAPPAVIGISEIENKAVLEDLIATSPLSSYPYSIIHYDSPDERGIDVALLYRNDLFTVEESKTFETVLPDKTDRTRDILLVSGTLDGDKMHFLVNHWPSRSGGEARSEPNRFAAAKNLKQIIDSLQNENEEAKIVSMGDFNDDPISPSIQEELGAIGKKRKLKSQTDLYNPYWDFYKKGYGTTAWRDAWSLFDMLIVTNSLLTTDDGYRFVLAERFNKEYMLQQRGRFKGYPKRTHSFGNYLNGYSDHFPVYIYLAKEI